MKRDLMILFAKAPVPGRVKTRLIGPLTAEQAATLHERLTAAMWRLLKARDGDCELHTDVPCDAWPEARPHRLQSSGDLGARMLYALETALQGGYRRVAIIGSDLAGLPSAHLQLLMDSTDDVALGPTADGGYYAIACGRTHAAMFHQVRWSTGHALEDTLRAIKRCGLTVSLGEPWFDVDTPEDLARLYSFGLGGGSSLASQTD